MRRQYYNESRIFVSFVRPQGGPTAGGSHIDVRGYGFLPSSVPQHSIHSRNVKCRFGGSVLVPATYHSPWRMSCVTPLSGLNTNVLVDVTFDDRTPRAPHMPTASSASASPPLRRHITSPQGCPCMDQVIPPPLHTHAVSLTLPLPWRSQKSTSTATRALTTSRCKTSAPTARS